MKPNVIFVLLDGSRTDRLDISKNFINLQKEGTLLNNVTCAYPYTFAAINAIFTGLFGKEKENPEFYYNLGRVYSMKKDNSEAKKYFILAAEYGHPDAQRLLMF